MAVREEYTVWLEMHASKVPVCHRWDSYANFLEDNPRPQNQIGKLVLRRISLHSGYRPGNCRWVVERPPRIRIRTPRLSVVR